MFRVVGAAELGLRVAGCSLSGHCRPVVIISPSKSYLQHYWNMESGEHNGRNNGSSGFVTTSQLCMPS